MDVNQKKKFQVTQEIYASMQQRFVNYIVDMIMLVFMFILLGMVSVIIGDLLGSKKVINFIAGLDKNQIALYTVTFIVTLIYYNLFEILSARTIGKLITKTIVVDENGEKPHSDRILIRSLCRLIPFNPFSVLVMGIGWHDMLSKTYVVDKKMLEQSKRTFYSSENQ